MTYNGLIHAARTEQLSGFAFRKETLAEHQWLNECIVCVCGLEEGETDIE